MYFDQQISLYTALTIFLFRIKVFRFFHGLRPFRAIALLISTCYVNRFIRDKEAHVHKLNFFLRLVTYNLYVSKI